jgi:hypothetical protein
MQGSSMWLDEMFPVEDQIPEVVVLDVLESWRCVFIPVDDAGGRDPTFVNIVVGKVWVRDSRPTLWVFDRSYLIRVTSQKPCCFPHWSSWLSVDWRVDANEKKSVVPTKTCDDATSGRFAIGKMWNFLRIAKIFEPWKRATRPAFFVTHPLTPSSGIMCDFIPIKTRHICSWRVGWSDRL